MTVINRLARAAVLSCLAGAASLALAQGASSPAKQALVQKALQLQQAGIENVGNALANNTANQVMSVAGQALVRVPADKRDALAAEVQAEVRKFLDDITPGLRAAAWKAAPSTLGATLDEKFSEDELKVLVGWLESPVNRKYQQTMTELQPSLGQKLVAESRPQVEPKLKALEMSLATKLNAAAGLPPPQAASSAKAAPAPKAAASKK